MIRKLKIKFIALSMISLFVLLSVIVIGMNAINYNAIVREADEVLSLLSQNEGRFPEMGNAPGGRLPPHISPELPYESRYFWVLLRTDGNVIQVETSRITAVDTDVAIEYAQTVMESDDTKGFIERFRFVRQAEGNTVRITFLDCGRRLDAFEQFALTSVIIALIGFAVVFVVITFFAGRIIRPIAESHEKQKRFITDAGHEIKTPLTIINADADVLELELGQNEWLQDIQHQAKRLTALTNDLVCLARMEEAENTMPMIEFPLSDVVYETVGSFKSLAQTQGKALACHIQPLLSMRGNDKTIQQLVSILMDNALKYSPTGSTVSVDLSRQGRSLQLTVCNTAVTALDRENLNRVFDRFYRADPSRNSETGGHGIGLSVAKAIVTAHGGKIRAWTPDGHAFHITATFPA